MQASECLEPAALIVSKRAEGNYILQYERDYGAGR